MFGRSSAPWLLAAGLWWPGAAARGQAPRAGVHHVQVVVSASSGAWQETGIIAAAGDLVVVTAEGRIEVTPGEPSPAAARPSVTTYSVDANGIGGSRSNDGTLELEVGTGPIESIGVRGFLFTADSGAVKLRVRARHPDQNAGSLRVGIVHVPSGLIPALSNGKPQGQPRPSSAR